ncbi:MAG: 7-cyano-7-deazaguanine synthase QueC [Spirochaetes bacterium]|nr:7-cyano-7-deazaguanine synthase QueC [Spirochaetota bacterium]
MEKRKKIAVVLLSGGIDSATTAAYAKKQGFEIYAITFSYGQRHSTEICFAEKLCVFFKIFNHIIIKIPARIFSSSALSTESESPVPKKRDISSVGNKEIPSTYVPGRNILFLSYALSFAESIGSRDIFIGANAVDYSGYPDCRPEFLKSFEEMANIGTKAGVTSDGFKIHAPLLDLKKSDIIKLGLSLGIDYSLTQSCYDPESGGVSCGECDSCQIRKKGFIEAGVTDPTVYRK